MRQVAIEAVFLLLVLKLPIVYLCAVVYWAVRAEPRPLENARVVVPEPRPSPPWRGRARRPPLLGGPQRSPAHVRAGRRRRTVLARAEARR